MAGERTEQRRRMVAEGRQGRTETEKRALQPAPGVWVAQSPTPVSSGASAATGACGGTSRGWMRRWRGRSPRPSSPGRSPPGCRCWSSSTCAHTARNGACRGADAQATSARTGCEARSWPMCATSPPAKGSGSSTGTLPGPVRPARTAATWARGSRPGGRGYPSRFRCGHCGWTGDANVGPQPQAEVEPVRPEGVRSAWRTNDMFHQR